jgi:preprotein translocase subunit SecE
MGQGEVQTETQNVGVVQRLKDFVADVRVESTKVSWPTRIELRDSTVVVIVTVLLVSAFLFLIDRVLQSTLGLLFR